jgi:transposase
VFGAFLSALWCFTRAWIKAPCGRQRFNVLGAINAISKEVISITNTDYVNSTTVCALLNRIKELNPSIPLSLILDNARYQRCNLVIDLAAKLNIELLFLPPYSPNLNLIERLWKFVKKKCLYAKFYPTFDAFTASIQSCLEQTCTTHLSEVQSLLTLNFQSFENCSPCPL